jgi:hypothetical protein
MTGRLHMDATGDRRARLSERLDFLTDEIVKTGVYRDSFTKKIVQTHLGLEFFTSEHVWTRASKRCFCASGAPNRRVSILNFLPVGNYIRQSSLYFLPVGN